MNDRDVPSGNLPDSYDLALDALIQQQSVSQAGPSQRRATPIFGIGGSMNYSVTTFRRAGDILEEDPETGAIKRGPATFTLFLEVARGEKLTRVVVPDDVLALVIRQRDSLTAQALRRSAKQAAHTRAKRGIVPAFLKKSKKRR